jgi:hypothetical protein
MEPSKSLWAQERNLKRDREVLIYLLTRAGRSPTKDILLLFADTTLGRSRVGEA